MSVTDTRNKTTLLDEMREARKTSNVAFITFTDNYSKFSSHVFCFYEGEDGKYYNHRIKSILGDDIITIITGNKIETLKIWRKIKSESSYESTRKMFFVDKDMDEIPEGVNEDLYVTPCYSIENLYVNSKSFGDILQTEFSYSKFSINYQKSIRIFEELFVEFNKQMIEFNALVLVRKRKNLGNGRVRLSDIKTHQIIEISIDGIKRGHKYDTIINSLKDKLTVEEDELGSAIDEIRANGDFGNLFRGKNQLDFMVAVVNMFKRLHNDGEFHEEKQRSVTINITNNRLSELSQYACFPQCLHEFIESHKLTAS